MFSLLLRAISRLRPHEGWTLFFLSLTAFLCPAGALLTIDRNLAAGGLLLLSTLAVVGGLRFARSRLSGRATAAWGSLLGLLLTLVVVGQLIPPLSLLWAEVLYTVDWIGWAPASRLGQPLPFSAAASHTWQHLVNLGRQVEQWGQGLTGGGTAQNPVAFLLLAAILAWGLGFFGAWQIYRRRDALIGLLPGGIAVTLIAFFRGQLAVVYQLTYLACTLCLIAATYLRARRDRWQETGTDYPDDLDLDLAFAVSPVLLIILLLATFFPAIQPSQVRDAFWQVMERPWSRVERLSERLFGPLEGQGLHSGGGSGGTLPESHLVGSGPELSEKIVLWVTTSDPPPPDQSAGEPPGPAPLRRYWRGATYDSYTGQGWSNSSLESRNMLANQPLFPDAPPGAEFVQQYELLRTGEGLSYAANAPLRVGQPVTGHWRTPGDLAELSGSASRYTAVSRPPEPTIAELRAADPALPPEIEARYLALPDSVPQRVLDLAEAVAGGAETRYDGAKAIESYLRAYTYTLDLPPPPSTGDLVDYFLFEQQEGYCDYYASAMVVMGRAVGIPARLASGYAQGSYDPETDRWIVTEKDGHSWVEVYFAGIGWVEFEPTAGLPGLDRPGGENLAAAPPPPLPPRSVRWWHHVPSGLAVMAGLLLLAVAVVLWIWRPGRGRTWPAAILVRDRYARLLGWGERLRAPLRDGQTPHEYGHTLSAALCERGEHSSWLPVRDAGAAASAEIKELTDSFVRAQYSPTPPPERESGRMRELWNRLRRRLWWLWLGR
jgi:transglutaminase-like putative cysteine protease